MSKDETISIMIVGDLCPINEIESIALSTQTQIQTGLFDDFVRQLVNVDYRIVNLECPLTTCSTKILKSGPCLKAHPKTINLIKEANFDLVTLANNHIYDYGQMGLEDTLNTCKKNNIHFVGGGVTAKDAKKTSYQKIKNKIFAIVNFCENEFGCASNKHGGANPLDIIDNTQQINIARTNADYVIVIIHGGHEHWEYPSPRMVKQYRFFADQGADIIVGHHAHIVSGYEIYKSVPIFYNIGNFLFPPINNKKSWQQGIAVKATFLNTGDEVQTNIVPFEQTVKGVKEMPVDAADTLLNKIDQISEILKNEWLLEQKWKNFVLQKQGYWINTLSTFNKRVINYSKRLRLLNLLVSEKKVLSQINAFKCESLRELMVEQLEDYISKKEQ